MHEVVGLVTRAGLEVADSVVLLNTLGRGPGSLEEFLVDRVVARMLGVLTRVAGHWLDLV